MNQIVEDAVFGKECQQPPAIVLICLHADPISAPGIGGGGGTHSYLRELTAVLEGASISYIMLTRWADASLPEKVVLSRHGGLIRLDIGGRTSMDKRFLDDHHEISVKRIEEVLAHYGRPKLFHSIYWNSGRAAAELASRLKIPFFHTVISNGKRRAIVSYDNHPPHRVTVEAQVFHAAARIFCICNQEREDLLRLYDVPSERISVVGRPVASTFFVPCRNGYGEPRLSFSPTLQGIHNGS